MCNSVLVGWFTSKVKTSSMKYGSSCNFVLDMLKFIIFSSWKTTILYDMRHQTLQEMWVHYHPFKKHLIKNSISLLLITLLTDKLPLIQGMIQWWPSSLTVNRLQLIVTGIFENFFVVILNCQGSQNNLAGNSRYLTMQKSFGNTAANKYFVYFHINFVNNRRLVAQMQIILISTSWFSNLAVSFLLKFSINVSSILEYSKVPV